MKQYVTVELGKGVYTYAHDGGEIRAGDTVIVDAMYSGARPAEVVATSKQPPSEEAAPDGYTGRAYSKTLR